MNRFLCLFAAIVLTTATAHAAEADEADEHAGHHQAVEAPEAPEMEQHDHDVLSATHLQENMKAMREMMAQIRATNDPAEKKRLLKAHMLAMREQIKVMLAMSSMRPGAGGMQHGKGGDMMKGDMMDEGMGGMMMQKKQHKMMERRMNSMEQLMQQLIEHESVESDLEGR